MKFDVAESASKTPVLKSLPEHLFRVTVPISVCMETEGEALERGASDSRGFESYVRQSSEMFRGQPCGT